MILNIKHETTYHYTAPLGYAIQQLRLSPRVEAHQHAQSWQVMAPGSMQAFVDAFGNQSHMLTISGQQNEVKIVAEGAVDVTPLDRGRLVDRSVFSPLIFTVPTRLTISGDEIAAFAARNVPPGARSAELLALAESIRGSVEYQSGATEVTSTALDALLLGRGVCQDHAHLFLACCHASGIPARYVSGYIDPGGTEHAASHAWVDVWVEEVDFTGWISIDVTHAKFAGDAYCRLAIGRDYDSAAPVRGVRRGGGVETLSVKVHVRV